MMPGFRKSELDLDEGKPDITYEVFSGHQQSDSSPMREKKLNLTRDLRSGLGKGQDDKMPILPTMLPPMPVILDQDIIEK